jgi:hypothetical protein
MVGNYFWVRSTFFTMPIELWGTIANSPDRRSWNDDAQFHQLTSGC